MYRIIFDKDELFTFIRDMVKEEIELNGEVNLIFLMMGIFLDLIFLPFELIKAIKIKKED